MRVVLIFPPRASATYMPLGIASLAPYMEQTVPNTSVQILDLNIETWLMLACEDPEGQVLLDFLHGRTGNFKDKGQTLFHKVIWDRLRKKMEYLHTQALNYAGALETDPIIESMMQAQARHILMSDPEWVGYSVLFPEQVAFAAALARAIKKICRPNAQPGATRHCRVVMGGAMMSAMSVRGFLNACPYIDGIVCGEGEFAAAALCRGSDWVAIPGLIHRMNGVIVSNHKTQTLSLKSLPAPDFSRLPTDLYFNPVPVVPVLFSRGCSWRKCRFCAHNFSFSGYRRKPVQVFVDEIEQYRTTMKARHFYSADEYILPDDMDAIASEIIRRGLDDINYHVLGKPTHDHSPDRMSLWASAGCRWIAWGIESGSQRLLDLINKGTQVTDIERTMEISFNAGISNLAMMIFGLPTSTEQDLQQTLNVMDRIYPFVDAISASVFVLFKGTHFAKNAKKYNLHILEEKELMSAGGMPVFSNRLKFQEVGQNGALRTPQGTLELAAWIRHRKWLGNPPLLEKLPSEHYLIHLSKTRQPA